MVVDPSRVTSTCVTLIDHIYSTNSTSLINVPVQYYAPGDHYPVGCIVNKFAKIIKDKSDSHFEIKYRNFKTFNDENEHAPVDTERVKNKYQPELYTDEICKSKFQREYFHKKKDTENYKKYRNILVRSAKSKYFIDGIDNDKNCKILWRHLKDMNSISKQEIDILTDEGTVLIHKNDIANCLNDHFSTVDEHAPVVTERVKNKYQPELYTDEICKSKFQREYFHKKKDTENYKNYRNILVRSAKAKYFIDGIDNDKNCKILWRHLKDMNSISKQEIDILTDEGTVLIHKNDIANCLNDHFSTVGEEKKTERTTYLKYINPNFTLEEEFGTNMETEKKTGFLPTINYCEPCYENHHTVDPENMCEECEEYLCESCTNVHCSQKHNKGHTIKPVPRPISCDPCSTNDKHKIATAFCLDCEEPEPLCDDCADQHKLMKKTKNHKMSMDKFTLNLKLKIREEEIERSVQDIDESLGDQTPANNDQNTISVKGKGLTVASCVQHAVSNERHNIIPAFKPQCEPCQNRGKPTPAAYFCYDCEERYCETCTKKHNTSKNTKNHCIGDIPLGTEYTNTCGPCKYNDKITEASHFCDTCEENLCEGCMSSHRSQKMARNHRIKPFQSEFQHQDDPNKNNWVNKEEQERIYDSTPTVEEHRTEKPGKPYVTEEVNKSDHVILKWEHAHRLTEDEFYQIVMKQHPDGKWKVFQTQKPCIHRILTVDGLKAETSYIFKVRVANDITGEEDIFSTESDVITTGESPAFRIMKRSEKIEEGSPAVYRLPIKEVSKSRNVGSQTRKFILGSPGNNTKEKTIMIVGATGSGKSTLINGMANYVMGVTWEDPFRFTLIHLENCEQERVGNEALSQTEWITCYTICSDVASRIEYTINFIDTPGFGDTRGLQQDAKIVSQIRDLFTAKDSKGVATLDAVCFILKAPDARLTTTQKYIFESILALFGNDIKNNICTLVTFADGQKPPVLAALEALDGTPLPCETFFPFNNSALYVDNRTDSLGSLSPFFWEMGMKSCDDFFRSLLGLQTKSLLLTSEVLTKRQKLENTILHLQEEIDLGLSKINLLEQEVKIFTKYKRQIRDNEKFEYEVEESKMEKVDISGQGIHTTTCLICNFTCHNSCAYANDSDKANCCAMGDGGNCTVCPKNCHWNQHSNVPYIFKWYTHKVKKTYSEMKDKYQQAHQRKMSQEDILEEMHEEIKILEVAIQIKVEEITEYGNRLKEIALRPDPLSTVQYIELMIESEMREKKSGFNQRVETLEQCKKRAEIGKSFQIFEHRLRDTRASIKASTTGDDTSFGKDNRSLFNKVKDKFKQLVF
ncbi:unnamed protein product [Mytilus coruscus]|uniref:Fibronectin type-III domain-containing protein n=1 Tax=Mytilus coruscus TaxID=42192 RepID=A0A6J7ZV32_MYTCO|nr:unnamed protein product [Mytilus coruscus]